MFQHLYRSPCALNAKVCVGDVPRNAGVSDIEDAFRTRVKPCVTWTAREYVNGYIAAVCVVSAFEFVTPPSNPVQECLESTEIKVAAVAATVVDTMTVIDIVELEVVDAMVEVGLRAAPEVAVRP